MSDLKRLAVVGGETHVGEIMKLVGKRIEIVGAAVREDQMDFAREHFGGNIVYDYRELLDATQPDIVAVANENDLKAEVCLEALRRGVHLVVDKPLALTLEETNAVREAARRAGRSVLVLLTLRGHPQYRKVREIVQSGEIGEPAQLHQKMSVELKPHERPPWFLDRRRSGGPILDLAVHGVDQFEWVSGRRIVEVTASEANLSHPEMEHLTDSGAMFFRLDNGGTAFIEHNRLNPPGAGMDYRLSVIGTKGQVNLRMGQTIWIETEAGRREIAPDELGPAVSVVEDWLDALNTRGEMLVPDEAGLRSNEICCLAVQAAAGGERIAIP